jgi:6-phosphogluconolactonase
VVFYAAIGAELTQYDVDIDTATLTKRGSITLPGAVTEGALHPSKKYFYIVSGRDPKSGVHGISAFRVDPQSGALLPHGQPVALPSGPGYISYVTTDIPGTHLMASDTDPSRLTVFRIAPDGTIGAEVKPAGQLDFGGHAHQVRVDPSNKTVIVVVRGDGPTATEKEVPGSLKIFSYDDGVLKNQLSIAPGGGFNYQPRHIDFHPSLKWDFVSLERQNKLLVYGRLKDGTLAPDALFTKETLAEPANVRQGQILGTVRLHPNGRFVYLANRASGASNVGGKRVFVGGENSIVVFAINQNTGEPTLIQRIETQGMHPRNVSLDPGGKLLIASHTSQLLVKDGDTLRNVPGSIAVFRIGGDGKLEFVRKYDVDVSRDQMYWSGLISLP